MDFHFVDGNGNHFVVPDAPDGYERDDATPIDPPPSPAHRWVDGEWAIPESAPAPYATPVPVLYAAAQLQFADGELTGIGINSRFAGAFPMDVGKYYVAFIEEQPDTDYMAQASAGHCMAYVLLDEKWTDGFMITTTNQAGEPVDVAFVNISIVRS